MPVNRHNTPKRQIDDATVKCYFNGGGGGTAATVSMMAHEHNLPASAVRYRLHKEKLTILDWLEEISATGRVLDAGCGGGTWAEIFARRYKAVIGIEQSPLMVKAARKKVSSLPNVEIFEGDVRKDLPEGQFNMIFLGGLCMYLNDTDVVNLLNSLKSKLSDGGSIILRESTVRQGVALAKGEYQAVYRSVRRYQQLFEDAGFVFVEVQQNYGYTSMVTAENLVDLRRRWLPFLPKNSNALGSMTWWALRATSPLSFWALPRVFSRLNISWPRLQNHFFRLRPLVD